MRRFTARRSASSIATQRVISSKVRRQLRQTSSPSAVEQWPVQGVSEVTSGWEAGVWVSIGPRLYSRCRRPLQPRQPHHRRLARLPAHLRRRSQAAAKSRPLRPTENRATVILRKLHTAHSGRLALRHAGQRGVDGRRGAAGGAVGAADHCDLRLLRVVVAASFLIASRCAFLSPFQNTRLYSFKCFHHWGAGVRLPFFTFAISNSPFQ